MRVAPLRKLIALVLQRYRCDLLALVALVGLCGVYFAPLFHPDPAQRRFVVEGDFYNHFYPFRAFAAQEWWQRRVPLWNPYVLAGHPFLADVQTAVFYPFSLLTAIVLGRGGLSPKEFELEMALHYPLAGLFAFLLARRLTGDAVAASLGAVMFAFGGYLTSYPMQQLAILETAVWWPLALYLIDRGADGSRPLPAWAAGGLVLGVAALAGHPQTMLYVGYATAAFLVWRGRARGHGWPTVVGGLAVVGGVAVGLAAVQLLPSVELLGQSNRVRMPLEEAGHGYEARALVATVLPRWRGELALYVGLAPLLLAGVAVWRCGRARTWFWVLLGVLSLVLSLGANTPLFPVLYQLAPGFNLFRDQERVVLLYNVSAALLAAHGLSWLLKASPDERRRTLGPCLTVTGLGFAVLSALVGGGLLASPPGTGADSAFGRLAEAARWSWLFAAAIFGWLAVAYRRPGWGTAMGALLVGLVVVDLFSASWGTNFAVGRRDPLATLRPIAERIHADIDELFRVRGESEGVLPSNYTPFVDLPTISGDTPIVLQRVQTLLATREEWRVWQLLNVKYEIAHPKQPAEGLELLDQVGPYAVFRMVYSLPRVWAVREAVVAESPDDALRRVLVPSYHPGDTVVLEEPPGVGPLTRGERPEVRVEHYAPQRIVLWARASAPAVLVLSETYYPGWRAWRDGVEVPVRRANYVVRALDLPPGEHRFEVVYDPLSFKVGAGISVATLLGVLAVLGVGWLKGGFPTRASRRAREIQAEVGATSAPVEGAPTRTSG